MDYFEKREYSNGEIQFVPTTKATVAKLYAKKIDQSNKEYYVEIRDISSEPTCPLPPNISTKESKKMKNAFIFNIALTTLLASVYWYCWIALSFITIIFAIVLFKKRVHSKNPILHMVAAIFGSITSGAAFSCWIAEITACRHCDASVYVVCGPIVMTLWFIYLILSSIAFHQLKKRYEEEGAPEVETPNNFNHGMVHQQVPNPVYQQNQPQQQYSPALYYQQVPQQTVFVSNPVQQKTTF